MPHAPLKPRLLILAEGNAESWDSWSGTSRSVLQGLREIGHPVISRDSDIYGIMRPIIGFTQYSTDRKRWWVKYHLGHLPYVVRSRNATSQILEEKGAYDAILQFGATFAPKERNGIPYFLYCDGNIALSSHARPSGQSEACYLHDSEIDRIKEREWAIYDSATHIFTISDRLRQSFLEDFSISPDKVTTVYAGANLPKNDFSSPSKDPVPRPPTILFVGRQFHRKGGDILLEAFAKVREEIPDARLLLLGPEGLQVSQTGVVPLGLIDKDASGGAHRIAQIYREAHVFCMPTRYEGLSISFLEAMTFGLPCVSTYTEWARPEMIDNGETGLVVPMDDHLALASALIQLLGDPEGARLMGRRGQARAKEFFTWDRVTRTISKRICRELAT